MTTDSNLDIFGEPIQPMTPETAGKIVDSWIWRHANNMGGNTAAEIYRTLSRFDAESTVLAQRMIAAPGDDYPITMGTINTLASEAFVRMSDGERAADYAGVAHLES